MVDHPDLMIRAKEGARLDSIAVLQATIDEIGSPGDIYRSFLCVSNQTVPHCRCEKLMRSQGGVEAISIA